ncbi:MAG: metal ABC transporter permease [Planctomycetota bacterium]
MSISQVFEVLRTWSAGDTWIVTSGILCAIAAALPGNFLVLRRMSLLGDAISHAILPGLAVAFLISHSRASLPMFLGAVIVGILTALFTEWIRDIGEVDEGASMGVVFTTLFALGLTLIVRAADHVDLDPGCVLYGSIELSWLDTVSLGTWSIPRVVIVLGCVVLLNAVFVVIFFKELRLAAFDPALATSLGCNARLMHYLLMIDVAVTAVACFETVGNILVVAMFVVPPATAFLLTNRLGPMVAVSVFVAIVSAVIGHVSALVIPHAFGFDSTSTSGMMALSAGLLFFTASIFAPTNGVVARLVQRQKLSLRILSEDLIALMYRLDERTPGVTSTLSQLRSILLAGRMSSMVMMLRHRQKGRVTQRNNGYQLTERGRNLGAELVRSHRLWEQYLVTEGGVSVDRIHSQAERLEHFTGRDLRERLQQETSAPSTDPHGRPIPPE